MKKLTFEESLDLFDDDTFVALYKEATKNYEEKKRKKREKKGKKEKRVGVLGYLIRTVVVLFFSLLLTIMSNLTPDSESILSGPHERINFIPFPLFCILFGVWLVIVYGVGMKISGSYIQFYKEQVYLGASMTLMLIFLTLLFSSFASQNVLAVINYSILFINFLFFILMFFLKGRSMLTYASKREKKRKKVNYLSKLYQQFVQQ